MNSVASPRNSGLKIACIAYAWTFFIVYVWVALYQTAIGVYLSRKLGSQSAAFSEMARLFEQNPIFMIILVVVMELICLLVALRTIKKHHQKLSWGPVGAQGLNVRFQQFAAGVGISAVIQSVMYAVLLWTKAISFQGLGFSFAPVYEVIGSMFLVLVVMAFPGFCEEILFRGVILENIKTSIGALGALVISSVLFSVIHLGIHPNLYSLLAAFVIGLVYGYLYIVTGSLYLPIGMHFAWDFFSEITKCGSALFNVRKLFVFQITGQQEELMLIPIVLLHLIVLGAIMIIAKRKTGKILPSISENQA